MPLRAPTMENAPDTARFPWGALTAQLTAPYPPVFPLSKFELFPKLPIELRLKVWKLSMPGPRRVDVRFLSDGRRGDHEFTAEMPVLLHVCQESRNEVLKKYEVIFKHPKALNQCYFNFELDTLHMLYSSCSQKYQFVAKSKSPDSIKKVQKLAIDGVSCSTFFQRSSGSHGKALILEFQNLKELSFVVENHNIDGPCWCRDTDFFDIATPYSLRTHHVLDQCQREMLYFQAFLEDEAEEKAVEEWQVPEILYRGLCLKHLSYGGAIHLPQIP